MKIRTTRRDYTGVTLPFKYSKVRSKPSPAFPNKKSALIPLIPIYFPLTDGTSIGYDCIIDSGADCCFFHWEIGEEVLGLDVKKGKKMPKVLGITGDTFDAYFHSIRFKIEGWDIDDVYVGFVDKGKLGTKYGILGQLDFFDVFQVIFEKSNDSFKLISMIPFEEGKIEPYEVTESLKVSCKKKTNS